MIYIFYHGDSDGITAGCIAYNHYKQTEPIKNIKTIKIDTYAQDLTTDIDKYDTAVFVDYSFTNVMNLTWLNHLYMQGTEIIWIDHHKSSIDNYEKYPFLKDIVGVRCDGFCGALLTWLYYNDDYFVHQINTNPEFDTEFYIITRIEQNQIPMFVRYVDSWDTWKHCLENTSEFELGFKSHGELRDPESDELRRAIKGYLYSDLIDDGAAISEYLKEQNKWQMESMGFECKLYGYNCFCWNGRGNSESFGDRINKYDICIMFYYDGDTYFYSLYSNSENGVDVEAIAKKFGGGGHVHASGFQTKSLMFSKGTDYTTL